MTTMKPEPNSPTGRRHRLRRPHLGDRIMDKTPKCRITKLLDERYYAISFWAEREVGFALRTQLKRAGAKAYLRSRGSVENRQIRMFVKIFTDMDLQELTKHVLDHFEDFEAMEMERVSRCFLTLPSTYRRPISAVECVRRCMKRVG